MNEIKTMHLFAGVGGGILADLILGHRPIVAVEWDKYACRVLRERVADGWFEGMSVWEGDVQLFDPSEYKGRVDCIHAGFPCQDISVAGNQAGVGEGTRSGLYREVLRIADEIQPEYIFLENVAAITTLGDGAVLRTVVGDLAERGYDAVWICLSAAEVGANHKRDRWWCLAYPSSTSSEGVRITKRVQKGQLFDGRCSSEHRQPGWWQSESRVDRVVNGIPFTAHRNKGLGNAQVPLQAATAFSLLWEIKNDKNTITK